MSKVIILHYEVASDKLIVEEPLKIEISEQKIFNSPVMFRVNSILMYILWLTSFKTRIYFKLLTKVIDRNNFNHFITAWIIVVYSLVTFSPLFVSTIAVSSITRKKIILGFQNETKWNIRFLTHLLLWKWFRMFIFSSVLEPKFCV